MKMHEEVYNALNEFVAQCFTQNAIADNIFYNLADRYLNTMANIFHHSYAHAWPGIADLITDEMLRLNARPIRLAVDASIENYTTVAEMMAVNAHAVEKICDKCKEIIELAEVLEDVEVKIFGENLLNGQLLNYSKQCNEWLVAAQSVPEYHFNIHFEDYTHFIPVVQE